MQVAPLSAAPSVCAGLQPALQHGWQAAFPLQSTPWRDMATRVGATSRELLAYAQRLQQQGLLAPVQVRWGERVRRQRWRVGFSALGAQAAAALQSAAEQEPTALCLEWVDADPSLQALPTVWLHLEAREPEELLAATQALEAAATCPASARWRLQQSDDPCACPQSGGPCQDLPLAVALESGGLPLVVHPFAELAARLGDRSERALLARLRDWQQQGWLQRLSLKPPFQRRMQRWRTWLLRDAPDFPLQASGLAGHRWQDGQGASGWWLSAVGDTPLPGPLPTPVLASWSSRVLRLRPQAKLYAQPQAPM